MNCEHCTGCALEGTADIVEGIGSESLARFLVVTDSPSARPESLNRVLSQSAMTLFGRVMSAEEFYKEDFYFYPHIRCAHDPDKFTTKEKSVIQKQCRPYFLEKLAQVQPEVIIPLGATAAKQVLHRAVKITKARGIPTTTDELEGFVILPMLTPIMAVLYPQHLPTVAADAATLGRLVDHDYDVEVSSRSTMGAYTIIQDLQFLIDAKPTVVSYDTENTGLRWYAPDAKILTMQFSVEPGVAYLLPWDHPDMPQTQRAKHRLRRQLRELLGNPDTVVVGQNAKYDCVYTAAHAGVSYRIGGCTLMMAALLDENSMAKNLDDLTKRYAPAMAGYADHFNATVDKSKMIELPLDDNFVEYGCGDSDAVIRVNEAMYAELSTDAKLLNHYHVVSIPGLNAFVGVELRGLHVDEAEVEVFQAFMEKMVGDAETALLAQVPKSIKRLHVEKGLRFSRHDFIRDILFYHEDGFCLKPTVFTKGTAKLDKKRRVPSTSTKDHLPYYFDDVPFTFELSEFIKMSRVLTTNVQGFKTKYIVDGKVRPVYNLHKAVTGRTSSEDPNGQNFPKRGPLATAYRRNFIAPHKKFLIEADLSQAELRIAADMANDHTMLQIYRSGGDIHIATALIALGVTEAQFYALDKKTQKDARTKAKAINFGFLYGMGWRGFIAYAKTQYGVVFTEREAQHVRTAFFAKYSRLSVWHAMMREFAHEHGFVRSYSGRIRHLPMINSSDDGIRSEAERQAINAPVQEFGSSLGVITMGRIEREVDPACLELVGFVHDALYAYVPKEYVEWGAKTLKWYMQTNPLESLFGVKMKCPIVADVGFGLNLGEVYEMGEIPVEKDGRMGVGSYDFGALWEEGDSGLIVPTQRVPANNGRLYSASAY
jgi:uracil-DNA glycosylase family 4